MDKRLFSLFKSNLLFRGYFYYILNDYEWSKKLFGGPQKNYHFQGWAKQNIGWSKRGQNMGKRLPQKK